MFEKYRVGILANEFFDPSLGGYGGFGWAVNRLLQVFEASPNPNLETVLLSGSKDVAGNLNRHEVIGCSGSQLKDLMTAQRLGLDLLISIDYRSSYLSWLKLLPRTPLLVWVRDPRSTEDARRISTLRIPGKDGIMPAGAQVHDCRSLGRFANKTRLLRRPILMCLKMPYMAAYLEDAYGVAGPHVTLPNPDVVDYGSVVVRKANRPLVVALGRLDPIKRPWLVVELARRFPEVDFVMAGKNQMRGRGSWQPENVPTNVKLIGHVSTGRKRELLSMAWVLVNTSIHEQSAVSMMEALAYETPILSLIESDGLSDRFGVCAGCEDGTGIAALPRLEDGLRELLRDHARRECLGSLGRQWVQTEHTTENFVQSFSRIAQSAGVAVSSSYSSWVRDEPLT